MDGSNPPFPVYIGIWKNWSYGPIFGSTLTLTKQNGTLLIAFIAFFVTIVGSHMWHLASFCLHWYLSTQAPMDGLHHQRQAVLRNSASPSGGAYTLLQIAWAWRNTVRRPWLRFGPVILISLAIASGLALVSLFSSRIAMGTEVLIASPRCGILGGYNTTARDEQTSLLATRTQLIETAAEYAQRCYSNTTSSTADCSSFVMKTAPVSMTTNASCPFDSSLCIRQNASVILDTGLLDSHTHLGLNSPADKRFQYRSIMHCSPLATDGFTSLYNVSENESYKLYKYGTTGGSDCNCTWRASMDIWNQAQQSDAADVVMGLELFNMRAYYQNGSLSEAASGFIPIKGLERPDADLFLIGLMAPALNAATPPQDDWYRLTTPVQTLYVNGNGTVVSESTEYTNDEPILPMGCIYQDQLCNPSGPGANRCTQLSGRLDALQQAMGLFNDPTTGEWIYRLLDESRQSLGRMVRALGSHSLESRYWKIHTNQWHLDMQHWFNTSVAALQLSMLNTAVDPTLGNDDLERFVGRPNNTVTSQLCRSQKMVTDGYISFSMFGLLFTIILGILIILFSLCLESLAEIIQRRLRLRPYPILEWRANNTLHLQRLAYEEYGVKWRTGSWDVPITERDTALPELHAQDGRRSYSFPTEVNEKNISVRSKTVDTIERKDSNKDLLNKQNTAPDMEDSVASISSRQLSEDGMIQKLTTLELKEQ
ncbi:hypothetical protein GQ53DRAFT_825039 [Thozetella sp. PMI_491]|nr:hypothetical protein GQ53DRAFT_825039 [Thozetella sp. PMI_491]